MSHCVGISSCNSITSYFEITSIHCRSQSKEDWCARQLGNFFRERLQPMVFCSGKQLRMQLYRRTPCDFLRLAVMVSHSQVPSAALELRMRNNEARCFTYRLAINEISDVRGSGPDPCIGFRPTVTDVTNPLTNQHQARSIVPGKGEKRKRRLPSIYPKQS